MFSPRPAGRITLARLSVPVAKILSCFQASGGNCDFQGRNGGERGAGDLCVVPAGRSGTPDEQERAEVSVLQRQT